MVSYLPTALACMGSIVSAVRNNLATAIVVLRRLYHIKVLSKAPLVITPDFIDPP